MLEAVSLGLSYGDIHVLKDINLSVHPREVVALIGASGSGKSSLLYCLSGLMSPASGALYFAGKDIGLMTGEEKAALRRREFGFVFQSSALVPELTLRQNISLPLELLAVPSAERNQRVDDLTERLGLGQRAHARPSRASGGEAQRTAVARAIVHKPSVIFADEPTGALDSANGTLVIDALMALAREDGSAVVLVTHDEGVACGADRVVTMQDGRTGLRAFASEASGGKPGR